MLFNDLLFLWSKETIDSISALLSIQIIALQFEPAGINASVSSIHPRVIPVGVEINPKPFVFTKVAGEISGLIEMTANPNWVVNFTESLLWMWTDVHPGSEVTIAVSSKAEVRYWLLPPSPRRNIDGRRSFIEMFNAPAFRYRVWWGDVSRHFAQVRCEWSIHDL